MAKLTDRSPEEKIISLIFSFGRLVREQTGEERPGNPSFIQLEMMKHIDETRGLTMKDMAQFLCIKAPSVTYLIEDLVRNGYVDRVHDTKDRRVVKIVLTTKGRKALRALYLHRADGLRKVLSRLDPPEKKAFIGLLERVHEIYKNKN